MKKLCFIICFWVFASWALAEGTKEVRPTQNDRGSLHIGRAQNNYTPFAVYDAPIENQMQVSVANLNETIYFGFGGVGNGPRNFRIKAPSGAIVYQGQTPENGDEGFIPNWNAAVAGPAELGNGNGYNALALQPTEIGDYVIEFEVQNNGFIIDLFDVTVANANNQAVLGRLHSLGWQMETGSYTNPFEGTVYPYDPNGIVYEVDFNGMQPYRFVINFNSHGTSNTGDFVADRQSKPGEFTYPEFDVFLNPPDPVLYPTFEHLVTFNGDVTKTDCMSTEYCLNFTTNQQGYLDGFIDIDGDEVYDSDIDVYFNHHFPGGGSHCVPWDGRDINGNLVSNSDNLRVIASFGFGVTHLPIFDAEHNRNGYIVSVVSPANIDPPLVFWDDSRINAGNMVGGDPLVNLQGCDPFVSGGCHKWRDRGDVDGNNDPNGPTPPETINTWWYSKVLYDTLLLSSIGNPPVQLSFDPAGLRQNDTTVCEGSPVPFYIYNDGVNHYDLSRFNYDWFFNGAGPVAQNVRNTEEVIYQTSQIVIRATDISNSACVSYDTLNILTVPPVTIEADIINAGCDQPQGSVTVRVLTSPPNPVFTWLEFPGNTSNQIQGYPGTYSLHIEDPDFPAACALDTAFTIGGSSGIRIEDLITGPSLCYRNTGTAEVFMEDPSRNYLYSWDSASPISSSSIDELAPGSHTVFVTEAGSTCSDETTFVIDPIPFVISATSENIACSQLTGIVNLTIPTDGVFNIYWNDQLDNVTTKTDLGVGLYQIRVESVSNPSPSCSAETSVTISDVSYAIDADFTYKSLAYKGVFQTESPIQFTNTSPGNIVSSSWDFGDGGTSQVFSPQYTYDSAGNYVITLSVVDDNGCTGLVQKPLGIILREPCGIEFPNAFTPNFDNMNDDIGILGQAPVVELKIFNRWGEVIFRTFEIPERWNGTYRGIESPVGVYPFILEWECPNEVGKLIKYRRVGDVTLIR